MNWIDAFTQMGHEDRVMTIVEDGSTLDALLAEAHAGREALALLREGVTGLGTGDVAASEARIAAARALLARAEEP